MQSAAGGTSQRLKPALAMVCSRSRMPSRAPDTLPVLLIVVIDCLPLQPPLPGRSATYDPVAFSTTLLPRTIPTCAGIDKRIPRIPTPDATGYARCQCRPRSETCLPSLRFVPCHGRDSTSAAPRRTSIGTERGTGVDRQKVGINLSDHRTAGY